MMARMSVWTAVPPIMPAQIPCKSFAQKISVSGFGDHGQEERISGQPTSDERDDASTQYATYQHAKVEEPAEQDAQGNADEVVGADVDVGHHGLPAGADGHT